MRILVNFEPPSSFLHKQTIQMNIETVKFSIFMNIQSVLRLTVTKIMKSKTKKIAALKSSEESQDLATHQFSAKTKKIINKCRNLRDVTPNKK